MKESPGQHYRCPACFELPSGEIYMCRRGHAICKTCYITITNCPVNNCTLNKAAPFRGRNVENMLKIKRFNCRFKVNGCCKTCLGIHMTDHERKCEFQSAPILTATQEGNPNKFVGGVFFCILFAVLAVYLTTLQSTPIKYSPTLNNQNQAESEENTDEFPYLLFENALKMENKEVAFTKIKSFFENGQFTAKTNQQNLLSIACSYSNAQTVKYLIEVGLSVNTVSSVGYTPLHFAVFNENYTESLKICKLLLENGADCNIKSKDGFDRTPMDYALRAKDLEYYDNLWELFEKYNPSCLTIYDSNFFKAYFANEKQKRGVSSLSTDYVKEWIWKSTSVATWDGLKYLLEEAGEEKIDINSADCVLVGREMNFTYLHVILIQESKNSPRGLEKIKFLVEEKGADVHAKDVRGMSLLHMAAERYTAKSVEYFLSKGLDVNGKGTAGQTPLSQSLENEDDGEAVGIAITLLKNGAECDNLLDVDYDKETWEKYRTRLDSLYKLYKPSCL